MGETATINVVSLHARHGGRSDIGVISMTFFLAGHLPCFTDEETEAQRGYGCPIVTQHYVIEPVFKSRPLGLHSPYPSGKLDWERIFHRTGCACHTGWIHPRSCDCRVQGILVLSQLLLLPSWGSSIVLLSCYVQLSPPILSYQVRFHCLVPFE